MTEVTALDAAYAAMAATPEDDAARLRYFERLADGELFLLLETEAEGETLAPRMFDLEDGPVVLVFDREDRLAGFTGIPAPYAALPGRVIAGLLAGQGIGLAVNLGCAASFLIPAEAVDWLAETLDHAPQEAQGQPVQFHAPKGLPGRLLEGLDAKLARAGGLAACAYLAGVTYADGRHGHMLAFIQAVGGAEPALARAAAEALTFSGIDAGEMDVTFLEAAETAVSHLARVGLRFDLPVPVAAAPATPTAPGLDPARPPILK
jgi:hypothetical protein